MMTSVFVKDLKSNIFQTFFDNVFTINIERTKKLVLLIKMYTEYSYVILSLSYNDCYIYV